MGLQRGHREGLHHQRRDEDGGMEASVLIFIFQFVRNGMSPRQGIDW